MSKFFKTTPEYEEEIRERFEKTRMDNFIQLNVFSTKKAKNVIEISRADKATEYMLKQDDILRLCVYEEAYELMAEKRFKFLDLIFAGVNYDTEKEKIILDKDLMNCFLDTRRAQGLSDQDAKELIDIIELSKIVIEQLEEKEKKEREERKASKSKKKEE